MADPFSIATGAIALGGMGFSIAKTLKGYVDSVRKAEQRLKPILRELEVISNILTHIGSALENGETRKLCTVHFFSFARSAVESCREDFNSLSVFVNGLGRIDAFESKMAVSAKLSLSFKQQELASLRENMRESKSSLNIVISTLQMVITMRTAPPDSAVVGDLKTDIQQELNNSRPESEEEEEELPDTADWNAITSKNGTESHARDPSAKMQSSTANPAQASAATHRPHISLQVWKEHVESEVYNRYIDYKAAGLGGSLDEGSTSKELGPPGPEASTCIEPTQLLQGSHELPVALQDFEDQVQQRYLSCLGNATLVSSDLYVEARNLMRQYTGGNKRKQDSTNLRSRYDEVQEVFNQLWDREDMLPSMIPELHVPFVGSLHAGEQDTVSVSEGEFKQSGIKWFWSHRKQRRIQRMRKATSSDHGSTQGKSNVSRLDDRPQRLSKPASPRSSPTPQVAPSGSCYGVSLSSESSSYKRASSTLGDSYRRYTRTHQPDECDDNDGFRRAEGSSSHGRPPAYLGIPMNGMTAGIAYSGSANSGRAAEVDGADCARRDAIRSSSPLGHRAAFGERSFSPDFTRNVRNQIYAEIQARTSTSPSRSALCSSPIGTEVVTETAIYELEATPPAPRKPTNVDELLRSWTTFKI